MAGMESCPKLLILPKISPQQDFVSLFMGKNVRKKAFELFRWTELHTIVVCVLFILLNASRVTAVCNYS